MRLAYGVLVRQPFAGAHIHHLDALVDPDTDAEIDIIERVFTIADLDGGR